MTTPSNPAGTPLFQIATLQNGAWVYSALTPQPNGVQHNVPPQVGTDSRGYPQVRGYGNMQWSYTIMRMDRYYYLMKLWKSSRVGDTWGLVRIQWPDPASGTLVNASARFNCPVMNLRNVAVVSGLTLNFTHLGFDDTQGNGFYIAPTS